MPTNFSLASAADNSKFGADLPALNAASSETYDQAPTGAWAPVNFITNLTTLPANGRTAVLVHIVSDVALRFLAASAVPTTEPGSLMLANSERTVALDCGQKLYIK